jgi:hypothetical protein
MTWAEADARTTATGLARYAFEYITAARLVDADDREEDPFNLVSPVPAYFLISHGIELTFRSFLRFKGVGVRDLAQKVGHDLDRCNSMSKEYGLEQYFTEGAMDKSAIELLVGMNGQNHALRYISTGAKSAPLWSIVEPLAVRLHQAVAPLAGYKSFGGLTFSRY